MEEISKYFILKQLIPLKMGAKGQISLMLLLNWDGPIVHWFIMINADMVDIVINRCHEMAGDQEWIVKPSQVLYYVYHQAWPGHDI